MNIYFVRHGESEGNKANYHQTADTPLTELGRKQAKAIARRMPKYSIDLVYASPMSRARETAEIIANKLNVEVELWNELHELLRPTVLRGKPASDFKSKQIDSLIWENFHDENWKHSDEENFKDINLRAGKVVEHLLKYHRNQNVLCVSHGTFIKAIVMKMLFGDELNPKIFSQFRYHSHVANTGISHCEYADKWGWSLISWNDTTHL